jgi:hypothetical protein
MKKLFVLLGAVCLVVAFTMPAMADFEVYGELDVYKHKNVCEDVLIFKGIELLIKQVVKPNGSAEAHAVKNDVSSGNHVMEIPFGGSDATGDETIEVNPLTQDVIIIPGQAAISPTLTTKKAEISGAAFTGAAGILNVNQSPGNINNQGNAVAVAYTNAADVAEYTPPQYEGVQTSSWATHVGGAFLHAEAAAEKELSANCTFSLGSLRDDLISGNALNNISGIVGVNQAAGSINNQNNAAAVSVGPAIAALSEADLGLHSCGNNAQDWGTVYNDTITEGAFTSVAGIFGVNQSSGSMNNQANVVAVSVLTTPSVPAAAGQ